MLRILIGTAVILYLGIGAMIQLAVLTKMQNDTKLLNNLGIIGRIMFTWFAICNTILWLPKLIIAKRKQDEDMIWEQMHEDVVIDEE